MIESVAVGIPTRDRPAQLREALDAVARQTVLGLEVTVVVADNSVARSAKEICENHATSPHYLSELRPGVSHVRNALLEMADELGVDALYFLDDDMVPEPGCLEALLHGTEVWPSTMLTGPVEYAWEVVDGVPVSTEQVPIVREERADGTSLRVTGTGNTLIPLAVWRQFGKPRFDPALGMSGGEDTDFFDRLTANGAQLRWCASARTAESLPQHLGTSKAVAGRYLRAGFANGTIALRRRPRLVVLWEGIGRSVVGAVAMCLPARINPVANARATFYAGLGRARAALRRPPRHYGLEG